MRASEFHQIDRLCERFERELIAGQSPRIEDAVKRWDNPRRADALRELLLIEIEFRMQLGEKPDANEYCERFPENLSTVRLVFEQLDHGRVGVPPHARPRTPSGQMHIGLDVVAGPHKGKSFKFTGHENFIVGRARCAHFRLSTKDQYFSRAHFMIEANPPLCRLIDLNSTNGTYVNGTKAECLDLQDGDRIRGGDTEMEVSIAFPEDIEGIRRELNATEAFSKAGQHLQESSCVGRNDPLKAIADYRIVKTLGQGGMGIVYLAERQHDHSQVAIKVIRPQGAVSDREIQLFLREARILQQLRHPYIVAFHELEQASEFVYFVMDYVKGRDAGQLVKHSGPLSTVRVVQIASQALQALQFAHTRGFVHRDVKPSNLLLESGPRGETCRLADFGLARAYQTTSLSGLTMTGAAGGTLPYMAPEQITDFRGAQPTTDQYGLAATIYRLLTGRYLFDFVDESPREKIAQVLLEQPVAIRKRRRDIPKQLASVIHKALAKQPEERFESCAEFRRRLLEVAG